MKKRVALLILILTTLFILTACGSDKKFEFYTGPIIMDSM